MKGNKAGFTLVELFIVAIIIVILALIAVPAWNGAMEKCFGRNLSTPEAGQVYRVMATDKGANAIIAMPWKKYDSDGAEMTDRRLLLKVSSNVCETGVWFVPDRNGLCNIIAPPVIETTNSVVKFVETAK